MSSYRPEQMRCYCVLCDIFKNVDIRLEYVVRNLKKYGDIDLATTYKRPILDIVLLHVKKKVGVRLMGAIHRKSMKRREKDKDQRSVLEWNDWKIIDMWYDEMPKLWSGEDGFRDEIIYTLRVNNVFTLLNNQTY